MSSLTNSQQRQSTSKLTESMRRFTLRSRKGSYSTSSSRDGSSATNESTSNSSRPSVTDSDRRSSKPSFASFSTRLRRTRSSKIEEEGGQTPSQHEQPLTLGERFFDLPTEIQTSILAHLSTSQLLTLRETSKQCWAIFQANATTITRNVLLSVSEDGNDDAPCSISFLLDLYPSTFASTTTDTYFLRTLRRMSLIKRQLNVLLTFVQTRVYMLKINTQLDCQHFSPYRARLYTHLYSCIGYVQHLFESIRHLVIHSHPTHSPPTSISTLNCCLRCTRTLTKVISRYPTTSLVNIHQVTTLLLQHLRFATRSPSNITVFERRLRGWGYGPPPENHLSQLILLGGIGEISKIDEMQGSYGKRVGIVKAFADMIAEATRINSIAFPDFYQSGYDPVMSASPSPPHSHSHSSAAAMERPRPTSSGSNTSPSTSKDKKSPRLQHATTSMPKQVRKDKYSDIRTALEAYADDLPVRKSLNPHLDLLTEQMVRTLPNVEKILVGSDTALVKRILDLRLVEHERDLWAPYAWIQRTMEQVGYDDDGDNGEGAEGGNVDEHGGDGGAVDGL